MEQLKRYYSTYQSFESEESAGTIPKDAICVVKIANIGKNGKALLPQRKLRELIKVSPAVYQLILPDFDNYGIRTFTIPDPISMGVMSAPLLLRRLNTETGTIDTGPEHVPITPNSPKYDGGLILGENVPGIIWDNSSLQDIILSLHQAIVNNEVTTAAMGVDLNQRIKDPLPVNTILASSASMGNPFGKNWMKCDGSVVYAEDYPDLLLPLDGRGRIILPNISDSNLSYYIKVSK